METKVICPVCHSEIAISENEHTVKNATVIGKDSNLGTVELPLAKKGRADERLEALRKAGVDTTGLFAMQGASGEGMIVRMKDGVPSLVEDDDPVFKAIVDAGVIPDRSLFRRWVTSQMFSLMTQREWKSNSLISFNEALQRKGYDYMWKMIEEELRVQCRLLDHNDMDNYFPRARWFSKRVVCDMMSDCIASTKKHIEGIRTRKCKGIPYKKIEAKNVFCSDIESKIMSPMTTVLALTSRNTTDNVKTLYNLVKRFNAARIKLPWTTKQCKSWVDAYKGCGAYFTMRNLIMFHGCCWKDRFMKFTSVTSLELVDERMTKYSNGEGWRMFAMMKKLIEDNGIDIEAKKKEWREKKTRR